MSESAESIRVLHVDADPDFAEGVATSLERADDCFEVETVTSASEGLDRLASGDFDCVVSEYDVPDRDGVAFLETVREADEDFPFVLFTGAGSETVAIEAIENGVTAYLRKERTGDQYATLADRIRRAVESYRERQSLVERDERFRKLVEESTDVMAVVDEAGTFDYLSPNVERVLGYDPAELVGQNVLDLVHPTDHDSARETFRAALADPAATPTTEFRYEHADGTYRWLAARYRNYLQDPTIGGVAVTVRDVTDRKETEEDLRETSVLLDNIFEEVPLHLYVKDTRARYIRVSEYYVNDLDTLPDAQDQVGKTDLDLFPEPFAREAYEDDLRVIESGEPVINKEEYEPASDEWNLTSKVPMYDRNGEVSGLVGVTWRITKRKEYDEELERQNERLDEFARMVSHDLRNPLNVVQGRLELLRTDFESEHFDPMESALDRMQALIENLLTLAREGKTVEDAQSIDLAATVEGCWRTVETADATLRADVEQVIRADRSRFRQLLENLFRNAVEHGGPGVTVTVGGLDDGFYVEDDGPGLSADDPDRVFDRNFSTSDEGIGFGLAIVKEIVDAHGWEIRVPETDEGGARFEITGVETD